MVTEIYINRIENRTSFKIKTWSPLELLTPKMMKLFGSTKNKISKNINSENLPHLDITKVTLVHCNLFNSG